MSIENENATVNSNMLPHGPRPTTMPRSSSDAPRKTASTVNPVAALESGLGEAASAGSPVAARVEFVTNEPSDARVGRPAPGAKDGDCRATSVGQHHGVPDMGREPERHEDDADREERG